MMEKTEAIWYLSPIAESATLPRYKEALEVAIAALREQSNAFQHGSNTETRWISVKERLPELGKEVLICDISDERKYMDVWSLEDDEEGGVVWEGKNGEWYSQDEATHWMPLPEPPKEGAGMEHQ